MFFFMGFRRMLRDKTVSLSIFEQLYPNTLLFNSLWLVGRVNE